MESDNRTTDEAAQIIANLVVCMDPWHQKNLSCVAVALSWLKANDRPGLWLNAFARQLMEEHPL